MSARRGFERGAPRAAAFAIAAAAVSCNALDPVHSRAIEALGPEGPGGASAYHRAGQPCGTCHQQGAEADTDFAMAGTVFDSPTTLVGVEGVSVDLVDAQGTSPPAETPVVTNCVGNFFVPRSAWNPAFPVAVRLRKGDAVRVMNTPIGHTASCADCHRKEVTNAATSVVHVYLFDGADPAGAPSGCPVNPNAGAK